MDISINSLTANLITMLWDKIFKLLLLILIFSSVQIKAQRVENLHFEQVGKQIYIY